MDVYYFIRHLYVYNQQKLASERIVPISAEAFNTLEAVVQREVKQLKARNPRDPLQMKTQDLLKILRTELEITTCIQSLIFGKFCSLKELEEQQAKQKADFKQQNENAANSSYVQTSDV